MSSLSFTKLFSSITDSSVWQESDQTRLVWITMLSMADPLGRVNAAIPGLAHRARVPIEEAKKALAVFMAPDPYSRSKEHDGRRIEEIDGGWRLLNYSSYREMKDEEARREKNRIYQERFRAKSADQIETPEIKNPGYIYYAQNGDHLKIGFSKNPWSRISELRCACPTLELVGLEKGTMQDEKDKHEKFSHLHHDREWFRLESELLEYINSLPILEKLAHGRYRNVPANPVVQTVAKKYKNVVSYDALRPATKAQEEVEEEEEEEASTSTKTTTLASSSIELTAARGKLVCTLPLNQGDHEVFDVDVQQWQALYPAVDVRQELRNMKGWLLGNPKLRKTKTGINRFINSWMSRAQNEAGKTGGSNGTTQQNRTDAATDRQRTSQDNIRAAAIRRYGTGGDDGSSPSVQAEPGTPPGDSGPVSAGVGGDISTVRDGAFQGRTLEGIA